MYFIIFAINFTATIMKKIDLEKIDALFEKMYFFNSIDSYTEAAYVLKHINYTFNNNTTEQKKLLCLSMYFHEKGDYKNALKYAETAKKNISSDKPFYNNIIHIQSNLIYSRCYTFLHNDIKPIKTLLYETFELSKNNNNYAIKDIICGLIDINVALNEYDDIYLVLQKLNDLSQIPINNDTKFCYYYGLARLNILHNELEEGIQNYYKSLSFTDRKEEVYCHISNAYRFLKQYSQAIDYAQKSIMLCNINKNTEILFEAQMELLLSKVRTKTIDKNFLKTLNTVLSVLNKNPNQPISYNIFEIIEVLAEYYCDIKDYDNSIKYYEDGISLINKSGTHKATLVRFKQNLFKVMLLHSKIGAKLISDYVVLLNEIKSFNKDMIDKYKNEHFVAFQTKQKELEIKQLKELDEYKKRFYTNITHDIRTPISLILAPLESSISQTTEIDQKRNLQTAYQNAKKLEYFLDQLLDLNKMEEGLLKPKYVYGNIKEYCLHIVETFQQQRKIAFTSTISHIRKRCYFDADAIGKILHNLVSNAIKFSAPSSMVCVNIGYKNNNVILSIKDNGIGISEDQLEKIFDRFYQIDNADTKPYQGSGIGLSIVKDYTNLLGGKISVESKLGVGTTFTIILPYKNKIDSNDLLSSDNITSDLPMPNFPLSSSSVSEKSAKIENDNRDTILLVDDNEELRNFLSSQLAKTYNIIEAENGAEGWQKAQKYIPTLVITDIMMPIMDGISMCEKIKANKNTNHIPVILLSAKTSLQAETTGYFAMADAYIKKPFSIEILFATIRSIIHNRNIIRSQIIEAIRNNLLTKLNIQTNDIFIKQFHSFIENNIYNPSLNVDLIARELNISRITLLRKVKHYTGKKTKEIITETRLNTAKILLEKKDSTVKNIAYSLGFVNIDHFYKLYKKQFGVTPANKNK